MGYFGERYLNFKITLKEVLDTYCVTMLTRLFRLRIEPAVAFVENVMDILEFIE
jgi:hypothetical protein